MKLREGITKTEVPPDRLAAHGEKRLAKFDDFPRTQSPKIQKNVLIASATDLRADADDRQDKCWR